MFKRLKQFFIDIKAEFVKVSWPTKEQTFRNTYIVVIFVIYDVFAIFIMQNPDNIFTGPPINPDIYGNFFCKKTIIPYFIDKSHLNIKYSLEK